MHECKEELAEFRNTGKQRFRNPVSFRIEAKRVLRMKKTCIKKAKATAVKCLAIKAK